MLGSFEELDEARSDRDELANAIVETAVRLGITHGKESLTQSEVLFLLKNIEETSSLASSRTDHEMVGDFHQKFNLPNSTHEQPAPRVVDSELLTFRIRFMIEELYEFTQATAHVSARVHEAFKTLLTASFPIRDDVDHAKAFDALLDTDYVVHGTAHVFGYPWKQGMLEVQRANMSKERAVRVEDSLRGSTYDVIKPTGWTAPDIAGVLCRYGWQA